MEIFVVMAGKLAKDRAKRKAQTQAKERASQPSPTTVQQGGRFRSAGPANRKPKSAPQQNFEDIAAPSTGFRDAENRAKENARRQQATLAVGKGWRYQQTSATKRAHTSAKFFKPKGD